jgi:hypothetical protein
MARSVGRSAAAQAGMTIKSGDQMAIWRSGDVAFGRSRGGRLLSRLPR